jgi:hypothetical protein
VAALETNFLFPGPVLLVPVVVIVAALVLIGVYLTVRAYRR